MSRICNSRGGAVCGVVLTRAEAVKRARDKIPGKAANGTLADTGGPHGNPSAFTWAAEKRHQRSSP
jgi:hypothetical protein